MRYIELLEFDDTSKAAVEPVPAKPASTQVYYHVTTKARLKSIQQLGIEPNHKRRWKTGFGNQLGERGNIYLISDFTAAVRWANKKQWEHFNGKVPDPSPYIILCVRDNPKNLEADPHPDNDLYGHTFFQKKGSILPEDITKVIPLTPSLIKQVVKAPVTEDTMLGLTTNYSRSKCLRALADKGWQETNVPNMYKNPDYPEYSVDLDIHNSNGGPFTVYRGGKKLEVTKNLPVAQHMGLKDRLLDRPLPPVEHDEWDFSK